MREIKFRAWDRSNEKMIKPALEINADGTITHYSLWSVDDKFPRSQFDMFDWMQYTGLKDKNGKDIYEGDIIFTDGRQKEGGVVVCWNQETSAFACRRIKEDKPYCDHLYGVTLGWEIIGNIYQNPELIR